MTRAELATILSRLPLPAGETGAVGDFTDTADHWAKEAVRKSRASGLLNGYEDGTFRPDRPLTRAEVAVILNRLLGRQAAEAGEPLYADVPPAYWAFEAIQAASRK